VTSAIRNVLYFALIGLLFLPITLRWVQSPSTPLFSSSEYEIADSPEGAQSIFQEGFIQSTELTTEVHSSTLTPLDNGNLLAAWYGGSREGARDVALYIAKYDAGERQWGEARRLTDPEQTQQQVGRYIKKVGNPVLFSHPDGTLWLFYVTVSVGGWAGSSINCITSTDQGETWSAARRLITSPFANISTLVKGTPVLYSDGSFGLPVYHEFLGKFGELLHLNDEGRVLNKIRITSGKSSLQPSIAALDETRAVALLRYAGSPPNRILETRSDDAGRSWQPVRKLQLPNPNSALMVRNMGEGKLLLVFNNAEDGRKNLSMALSEDEGQTWKVLRVFEEGQEEESFSYPYLIEADDGLLHLTYTWNKRRIKHLVFNRAWLKEQAR
jgi:predicted neuraminidase